MAACSLGMKKKKEKKKGRKRNRKSKKCLYWEEENEEEEEGCWLQENRVYRREDDIGAEKAIHSLLMIIDQYINATEVFMDCLAHLR